MSSNKDSIENKVQQGQIRPIKPVKPIKPIKPIARPVGPVSIKPSGVVPVQRKVVITKQVEVQKSDDHIEEQESSLTADSDVQKVEEAGEVEEAEGVEEVEEVGFAEEVEPIQEAEPEFVDEPVKEDEQKYIKEDEPVKEDEPKAKWLKFKDKEKDVNKTFILYLVIDKPVFGILNYFREHGVNVSNMFDDITEAKNMVLMQSEPVRIVVVDTGTGKFATPVVRRELIDMLGVSDESNKITVFYTESALKLDAARSLGNQVSKDIDWILYRSTMIVVATLLSYHENYIDDYPDEPEQLEDAKKLLAFKGECDSDWGDLSVMEITGFSADNIRTHVVKATENELEGFKIKL